MLLVRPDSVHYFEPKSGLRARRGPRLDLAVESGIRRRGSSISQRQISCMQYSPRQDALY